MIPELLYHTTLTVVDYYNDTSGFTRTVYVLGTHATLAAAKAFAATALQGLGYAPADFAVYDQKTEAQAEEEGSWTHGDGVVVYAKAFAGQELIVGLDTTPNEQEFAAGPDGNLLLSVYPDDSTTRPASDNAAYHLHYVLQTKIDYDQDRSGAFQTTDIEGCYLRRGDALAAAKACLPSSGEEFAQYDENDSAALADEWPFGEDVVVHAVSQTGENYSVAIRTIPGAHKKHAKAAKAATGQTSK